MKKIKYTTIDDIKTFLLNYDYYWLGKVNTHGREELATIKNFEEDIVSLRIHDGMPNKFNCKSLKVFITDTAFHIVHDTIAKKYDFTDHSLRWQAFMINRKDVSYAKLLQDICLKDKALMEEHYNKQINLVVKQAEKLKYEKSLEMAKYNTTLANIETKLSECKNKENQIAENTSNS